MLTMMMESYFNLTNDLEFLKENIEVSLSNFKAENQLFYNKLRFIWIILFALKYLYYF